MHLLPLVLLSGLLSAPAAAQDAVRLEVVRQGVSGGSPPALIVHPQVGLADLTARLECGGASASHEGPAELAVPVTFPLAAAPGKHRCGGTLSIRLSDGSEGEMPLSFEIEVVPPVTLTVAREELELSAGRLVVRAERPLASGSVVLSDHTGELGSSEQFAAVDGGLRLSWAVPDAEVLQIRVVATDDRGFASQLDLFPWSYSVPHEDVVFETNKAEVRPEEEHKLDDAWARVQEVVARYGKVAPVNLYVAGYTDTVGSETSNQRLSEARARAIATWFSARGFPGAIHYQGFGEKGLAVPTPDETDEERNRRVDYIIAAEAPPITERVPHARWTPL